MSIERLAKMKAKGTDQDPNELKVTLRARSESTYINPDYVELILRNKRGFVEIGYKS